MRAFLSALILVVSRLAPASAGDEFEQSPINYSRTEPENCVSRLQHRIERGETTLSFDERLGYLPSLLKSLEILPESQTLVFSKTSMQRDRISPRTPRALYFNDDVYLGFCRGGDVLEIAVADPNLGAVFYTLDQAAIEKPRFARQTDNCLLCHGSSQTDYVPGHRIRSVFVDRSGMPILSQGSTRVDHTTPLERRWGGWYVTGKHGAQTHLGNLVVADTSGSPPFDNRRGLNVTDLGDRFSVEDYLTPHSDLVALMVVEHQTLVHNLITKAGFGARQALHYDAEFHKALGEPAGERLESTTRRIHAAGDRLLEGLLFTDEAPLQGPISGSTDYAERFAAVGPRDGRGRSLRDFDLQTRMFKYPCSYLIYSEPFDRLPDDLKRYVAARLRDILTGKVQDAPFAHLSGEDRRAILEILQDTKPNLWPTDRPASGVKP